MARKYEKLIRDYCECNGIAVPPGFGRNTPSRYAIIRTHYTPPKLIAATWFKTADVVDYIERFLKPELGEDLAKSIRILDFQTNEQISYTGGKRLVRIAKFDPSENQKNA